MKPIVSIHDVGKRYSIGTQESYTALRDTIADLFKPGKKSPKDDFWALKDISFDVNPGESLGVIGRNGAGKSTLLKILSQITPPTTGKISLRGRVASLLEVGTGFHPELTGRENIYLNGAILGMTQQEIKRKFDEIVDFSGVEKFLDTPVKRYSSGMYVRLAFAVAAHLEPEILIVDEVLAVGDAEFQKKCIGKMEDVTQQEGRTILFVSHNLITIQTLCKNTVLLENGKMKKIGPTAEVIETYLNERSNSKPSIDGSINLREGLNAGDIRFTSIRISNGEGTGSIRSSDKLRFEMDYTSDHPQPIADARIVITVISDYSKQNVLRLDSDVTAKNFGERLKPEGTIICETDANNLIEGKYTVDINFVIQGTGIDDIKNACEFDVETDINSYDYRIYPDKYSSDHLIRYSFKQK